MGLAARHPALAELLLALFFSAAVSGTDASGSRSDGKVEKIKSSSDSDDSSLMTDCLVLTVADLFSGLSVGRPVCIAAG